MWSGTITFGLINIPVDILPVVRARQTSMHLVDSTGQPLGRRYYCPKHKKVLSPRDIVRGYKAPNGKYLIVTDEELDAIAPEMSRDIELRSFVPLNQISPKYFDHPYILAPSGRSTKAYDLLSAAIAQSKRAGIGTFVMRGHQYLVAILSEDSLLRAQTLRFADEVRSANDIPLPKKGRVSAAKLDRYVRAIKAKTTQHPKLQDMTDRYAQRLRDLAVSKAKDKRNVVRVDRNSTDRELDSPDGDSLDLMEMLREQLGARARPSPRTGNTRKSRARKSHRQSLVELSKSALMNRARELRIAGRARMTKPALLKAIRNST